MTGVPVIASGPIDGNFPGWNMYEVCRLIRHGEDGICIDNVEAARRAALQLLSNYELAREMGRKGRQSAIKYFGWENVKKDWYVWWSQFSWQPRPPGPVKRTSTYIC